MSAMQNDNGKSSAGRWIAVGLCLAAVLTFWLGLWKSSDHAYRSGCALLVAASVFFNGSKAFDCVRTWLLNKWGNK